ncbi:putative DNA-polymerase epsilon, calytic chain POL2, partial [Sesbania bispinosa]
AVSVNGPIESLSPILRKSSVEAKAVNTPKSPKASIADNIPRKMVLPDGVMTSLPQFVYQQINSAFRIVTRRMKTQARTWRWSLQMRMGPSKTQGTT